MDSVDQDMISRERRDQYLAAMGIQVWAPRGEVIDGEAAVSETVAVEQSISPPGRLVPSPPRPVAKVAKVTPPAELEPAVAPALESRPDVVPESIPVPRFYLSAVFLPELGLVVSDVPLEADGIQPQRHQALLGEILVAMGFSYPALSHTTCFKWPMFEQGQIDQGEEIARDAVGAYVSAQLSGTQPKFLLLLGAVANNYLMPVGPALGFASDQRTCPVIACPGLEEMIESPGLKSRAWQNICEYLNEREQPGSI